MAKVLILDQSKSIRNTLRERLEFEGIAAESAENEAAASVLCERIPFDLIISDHETRLPESDVPFIVLSSEATVDSAIKALRNGAQDYLTKPIDMNRLMQSIRQTLEQAAEAPRTAAKAKAKRSSAGHTEEIIGTSEQMQHVRRLIDKVAPCDARVLITGENGTGKELVARWLHAKSNRAGAPFVEVNCAAIPSELIESELFGHERGAFTSAIKQRKGKFEQASGGTLFMDEIGDMSLADQFGVDKEKITADSISGAVSQEMKRDAIVAVTIATICMLIYIWFRFSNITFAAGAVLALMHDVLVVLTCYAMLRWSVGSTFIACMLTIVGYSINATIVIFDRIRENMKLLGNKESAETIVNTSISQTLTRSINTTLTTFVMVLILYILGVSSIREFALPLMVGLICGTYSSVCLSGSVWYVLNKKRMEKNAKPAGKKAKAEK